jgi:hypothetical protein
MQRAGRVWAARIFLGLAAVGLLAALSFIALLWRTRPSRRVV